MSWEDELHERFKKAIINEKDSLVAISGIKQLHVLTITLTVGHSLLLEIECMGDCNFSLKKPLKCCKTLLMRVGINSNHFLQSIRAQSSSICERKCYYSHFHVGNSSNTIYSCNSTYLQKKHSENSCRLPQLPSCCTYFQASMGLFICVLGCSCPGTAKPLSSDAKVTSSGDPKGCINSQRSISYSRIRH